MDPLNLKKFFLEESGGSLEHGPWRSDKKIKNSVQFQKCIQKVQRGHGGKRLGWHRGGTTFGFRYILVSEICRNETFFTLSPCSSMSARRVASTDILPLRPVSDIARNCPLVQPSAVATRATGQAVLRIHNYISFGSGSVDP